jgi:hypothetical protein
MYRVVNGNRIRLEREDDLELDPDAWHSLKIFQEHGQIRVYLGGIRVSASAITCLELPASVGLWTGGDSTVMFDDFRIEDETEDAPAGACRPHRPNNESARRRG